MFYYLTNKLFNNWYYLNIDMCEGIWDANNNNLENIFLGEKLFIIS